MNLDLNTTRNHNVLNTFTLCGCLPQISVVRETTGINPVRTVASVFTSFFTETETKMLYHTITRVNVYNEVVYLCIQVILKLVLPIIRYLSFTLPKNLSHRSTLFQWPLPRLLSRVLHPPPSGWLRSRLLQPPHDTTINTLCKWCNCCWIQIHCNAEMSPWFQ